jgi:putative oxidoreductase
MIGILLPTLSPGMVHPSAERCRAQHTERLKEVASRTWTAPKIGAPCERVDKCCGFEASANARRMVQVDTLFLLGRIVLGCYFLYSGFNHFSGFAKMKAYARAKGVPLPAVAQAITGLMLLVGGASIVFGLYPIVGILLLVAFLIPVSLMMHNFWEARDPQTRMADKINFNKNMALVGAILMLLAVPTPWPMSLIP